MRELRTTLVVEGVSDSYFLPIVLTRALNKLCRKRGSDVEVYDVEVYGTPSRDPALLAERLVADQGDYDLIFLHRDHRKSEEWMGSFDRRGAAVLTAIVRVIPVHETEAWMLVDKDAVRSVSGKTGWKDDRMGMPARPADVEKIADPKKVISRLLADPEGDYDRLASVVRLDLLAQVPAYRKWLGDTGEALADLGILK